MECRGADEGLPLLPRELFTKEIFQYLTLIELAQLATVAKLWSVENVSRFRSSLNAICIIVNLDFEEAYLFINTLLLQNGILQTLHQKPNKDIWDAILTKLTALAAHQEVPLELTLSPDQEKLSGITIEQFTAWIKSKPINFASLEEVKKQHAIFTLEELLIRFQEGAFTHPDLTLRKVLKGLLCTAEYRQADEHSELHILMQDLHYSPGRVAEIIRAWKSRFSTPVPTPLQMLVDKYEQASDAVATMATLPDRRLPAAQLLQRLQHPTFIYPVQIMKNIFQRLLSRKLRAWEKTSKKLFAALKQTLKEKKYQEEVFFPPEGVISPNPRMDAYELEVKMKCLEKLAFMKQNGTSYEEKKCIEINLKNEIISVEKEITELESDQQELTRLIDMLRDRDTQQSLSGIITTWRRSGSSAGLGTHGFFGQSASPIAVEVSRIIIEYDQAAQRL